jgi:hypothetical protein
MIHYFNPGHETAVLRTSKYYQPPASIFKMQKDLAFLPAWYASPNDYVLTGNGLNNEFLSSVQALKPFAKALVLNDFIDKREELQKQKVVLWGISPQSIHHFEKLNKTYHLQLEIPQWQEELRPLGSRITAQKILSKLSDAFPDIEKEIIPQCFSHIGEIERYLQRCNGKQLIKSPYSSSGRGLLWLPPGKLAQSERQILNGMLKKQTYVSMEKALDKQLDFSMHFENNLDGQTRFIGYSLFQTNTKGAYVKSILANQEELEKQITAFIGKELLLHIRTALIAHIQETYIPYYKGNIGVDMLIYHQGEEYKLNPCVEINMRKSMGYLAIRLFEKYLHPDSRWDFGVEYHNLPSEIFQKHRELQKCYLPVFENGLLKNGYLNLCPLTEASNYHAYLLGYPHLEVPQFVHDKQPS